MPYNLEDVRWLTGPDGADVLDWASTLAGELTSRLKHLRAQLPPDRAHLVLQQIDLRRRGREKFAAAERMFFTPRGLEQATDEVIASHKAVRFAGRQQIYDLCTGIGGDLLSLGNCGAAIGFDRDPICATISAANVHALARNNIVVRCNDVAAIKLADCDAWHIDPDRRPQGRRTTRVELHEPSAASIEELLGMNPNAAVKLAPGASWPNAWCEQAEWEWISRGRECRQLVAWFGEFAQHRGQHRATRLGFAHDQVHTFLGQPGEAVPLAPTIDRFIFEPDAAVLAAKLSQALAAKHNLAAVAAGIAYWTGPKPVAEPLLSCFEVTAMIPFNLKKIRALLRDCEAGPLEIKVRGVNYDPSQIRKSLNSVGARPYTLLITRVARQVIAILAKRVVSDAAHDASEACPQ